MEVILKRKYIYIVPAPKKDIKKGLYIRFDRDTKTMTDIATADIEKGKSIYTLPEKRNKKRNNRKVIKAWVVSH